MYLKRFILLKAIAHVAIICMIDVGFRCRMYEDLHGGILHQRAV